MTPSRDKGNRAERDAEAIYEDCGYRVFRPQESKFGETDIYGAFDILATPPAGSNLPVRFVQVKSNRAEGIETWREDAMEYATASTTVEMLIRHDGHGGPHPTPPTWRVIVPYVDPTFRHEVVVDEREDGTPPDGAGVEEWLRRA